MWAAKPHAAHRRLERGKMDLARLGRGDDPIDIARCDSPAGHDDDAVPRALDEINNERQPFDDGRLLARSQHAIDAQPDKRFERSERFVGHVKRPVKCDGKRPSKQNQLARARHVNFACGRQQANDDAVSAFSLGGFDVRLHGREFIVIEQEVAAARPDHHIEPDACDRPRPTDHATAWRDPSLHADRRRARPDLRLQPWRRERRLQYPHISRRS